MLQQNSFARLLVSGCLYCFAGAFLGDGIALAQILEKSEETVYGPSTIHFVYEEDLANRTYLTHSIDTALFDFENFTFVDQSRHRYRNLANLGTALIPVFQQPRDRIGVLQGYRSYEPYRDHPGSFKYYNTRSPYIYLYTLVGGQGRSKVEVNYTQNVAAEWNIGASLRQINSDKQIGAKRGTGDRNVESRRINLHSYFHSKDSAYYSLFHLSWLKHNVSETGGILFDQDTPDIEIFRYEDAPIRLDEALAKENSNRIHLFHSFGFSPRIRAYHSIDYSSLRYAYQDEPGEGTEEDYDPYRDYYLNFLIDEEKTDDFSNVKDLNNRVGFELGGSIAGVRIFASHRHFSVLQEGTQEPWTKNEFYVGGATNLNLTDRFAMRLEGEYLFPGNYNLLANLGGSGLSLSWVSQFYKPSHLAERYRGNHHQWNQDLPSGIFNQLTADYSLKFEGLTLSPKVVVTMEENFVYFDQDHIPKSSSAPAFSNRMGGSVEYALAVGKKKTAEIRFENEIFYSTFWGGGSDLLRIPPLFYYGRIFFLDKWFKGSVPVQLGLCLHYKSQYNATAYDPVIQQFHLQDSESVENYLAMDAFLSMTISHISVLLKSTHLNQPRESGYFTTPYYSGQPRVLDFGVRWLFFD